MLPDLSNQHSCLRQELQESVTQKSLIRLLIVSTLQEDSLFGIKILLVCCSVWTQLRSSRMQEQLYGSPDTQHQRHLLQGATTLQSELSAEETRRDSREGEKLLFTFGTIDLIRVSFAFFLPRPLMPLVSEWNINHSHQSFLEEGPVALTIVLLQHLTAPFRAHRKNQPAPWL